MKDDAVHHRAVITICVPLRPPRRRLRCAASASARDANGPETTCRQPSRLRRRIGRPSAATSAATDAARTSVRNDATTISKGPPVDAAAGVDGAGAIACGAGVPAAGAVFGADAAAPAGAGFGCGLDARGADGAGAAAGGGACAAGGPDGRTKYTMAAAARARGIPRRGILPGAVPPPAGCAPRRRRPRRRAGRSRSAFSESGLPPQNDASGPNSGLRAVAFGCGQRAGPPHAQLARLPYGPSAGR